MKIEREDLQGLFISSTIKPMPTGEIRCRMKTATALGMQTKAVHITKAVELTWQGQFHRHHYQRESYIVIAGKIGMVSWDGKEINGRIVHPGDQLLFFPGVWHDICTTPEAEFVTLQVSKLNVDVADDRELWKDLPVAVQAEKQRIFHLLLNS